MLESLEKKCKLYMKKGSSFEIGKGIVLKEGSDVTIIATGLFT